MTFLKQKNSKITFFYVNIIIFLLHFLLCNNGLKHQNLSHLNRTHKQEKKTYIQHFKINLDIYKNII